MGVMCSKSPCTITKAQWRQVMVGIAASVGSATEGIAAPFPSAAFPQIRNPDSDFKATDQELSAAAGAMMFCGGIGCILSGPAMDKIGRRCLLLIFSLPMASGFGLIAGATNPLMMIAGRALIGLAAGITVPTGAVYASETADSSMRGATGSFINVLFSLGNLLAYILCLVLKDWRMMAYISIAPPVLFFFLLLFMPDSPRFLLKKEKNIEALDSLKWLRATDDVQVELMEIKRQIAVRPVRNQLSVGIRTHFGVLTRCFILGGLFGSCGGSIAIAFAEPILLNVQTPIRADIVAVIAGAILSAGSIATIFLMDRVGRLPLLKISGGAMSTLWFILSFISFFFHRTKQTHTVATVIFLLIVFAFSLGYRTVPTVLISESLPFEVRGVGTSITLVFTSLCIATLCYFYLHMMASIYVSGTALVFGLICALGAVFPSVFFEETKGRSLEGLERQALLDSGSYNRRYGTNHEGNGENHGGNMENHEGNGTNA